MTRKLLLLAVGVAVVAYLASCVLAGAWEERRRQRA
jgi:hypothetical protein